VKEIDRVAFRNWLADRAHETVALKGHSLPCPLMSFLGGCGTHISAAGFAETWGTLTRPIPTWASKFISEVDHMSKRWEELTGNDCIAVLDKVPV
jgi:hypothetical protein